MYVCVKLYIYSYPSKKKHWVHRTVIFWVCGTDIKYLSKSSLTVAVEPTSYSCDCARRTAISMVVKKKQAGNRFHILAKCKSMEKCLCPESGKRSQNLKTSWPVNPEDMVLVQISCYILFWQFGNILVVFSVYFVI